MAYIEKKSRQRTNNSQLRMLVDFMYENRRFAAGKFTSAQGRLFANNKWTKLVGHLNRFGQSKTVTQWQKVWADLKIRTKKSVLARQHEARSISNNTDDLPKPNAMEQKILTIIGKESMMGVSHVSGSTLNITDETVMLGFEQNGVQDVTDGQSTYNAEITCKQEIIPTETQEYLTNERKQEIININDQNAEVSDTENEPEFAVSSTPASTPQETNNQHQTLHHRGHNKNIQQRVRLRNSFMAIAERQNDIMSTITDLMSMYAQRSLDLEERRVQQEDRRLAQEDRRLTQDQRRLELEEATRLLYEGVLGILRNKF